MKKREMVQYTRLGQLGVDDDKLAEYLHWDSLGAEARFQTAWDLVVQAHQLQGKDLNELRFQRSVETILRQGS